MHQVGAITGKHKFTREEMDEIREREGLLYQKYVIDKQIQQEKERALYFEEARAARDIISTPTSDKFKPMSKEDWADERGLHRNLKDCKPGPPQRRRKLSGIYHPVKTDYPISLTTTNPLILTKQSRNTTHSRCKHTSIK